MLKCLRVRSLNPCCSGRWSRTYWQQCVRWLSFSLNPYCSGRWSRTQQGRWCNQDGFVLILIVVEDGLVLGHTCEECAEAYSLNPCCDGRWSRTYITCRRCWPWLWVLILIVVDNGLVLGSKCRQDRKVGLNPCCDGRWSRTLQIYWQFRKNSVLILVVVDDDLVLPVDCFVGRIYPMS